MTVPDVTQRFTTRVQNYVKYRPDYPAELLPALEVRCQLTPQSPIADIGSGTGLLTQRFLDQGNFVSAVEPNAEMRRAAEARLASYPNFRSIAAQAEATTLADSSIHLITAGQAFHWFDPIAARQEFQRILRPNGWVALIWNDRRCDTPFLQAYELLLQRYGTDYAEVMHRHPRSDALGQFYGPRGYSTVTLPHHQAFDYPGLEGRLLSSSYTPEPGHPDYGPMLAALSTLFDAHAVEGQVLFNYRTRMHYGQLS